MNAELPAPLTPPDCDLQDFKFMPLDVGRLRDSDLASDETPEACWAAVLLWCASWHQIPAASIPDNDQWLAKQAGYAQRGKISEDWAAVKAGAMRGWIKCSDGRLYHPVVAEKAIEAWESKRDQRWRTECGRIKKHNDRHGTDLPRPTFEQWVSQGCPTGQRLPVPGDTGSVSQGTGGDVPGETGSKGQGEGQGQGQGQGQINTKGAKAPSPADKLPPCQGKAIVDLYHQILPELPSVVVLDSKPRQAALRKTWAWVLTSVKPGGERRATNAAEALEWFRAYFERARENDFLMGKTPRSGPHANWRCDLDFLLTDRGMKHVIERTQ